MAQIKVLLVEDNPVDTKVIEWVLDKEITDKTVARVTDGQQAIDYIFHTGEYKGREDEAPTPDLILLDIHMPKVGGIETLKRIKADARFASIHIVVLTHSKDEEDLDQSFEHGAVNFIQKTESLEELHSTLQLFLSYWQDKSTD